MCRLNGLYYLTTKKFFRYIDMVVGQTILFKRINIVFPHCLLKIYIWVFFNIYFLMYDFYRNASNTEIFNMYHSFVHADTKTTERRLMFLVSLSYLSEIQRDMYPSNISHLLHFISILMLHFQICQDHPSACSF